jgi:O-acetyl-ADP-ribose deacetylase (regulator of RNase III)
LTLGYDLPAKFVIHCVGPIWKGGNQGEPELLQSCYVTACRLAQEHQKINSIAFPSISTGVYAYPKEPAAEIALRVCRSYCESLEIVFCCFSKADLEIYSSLFPDLVQIDQNLETIP